MTIRGLVHVRFGSWLRENSGAHRAGRNISKKLRIIESNRAARAMCDTLLENCIFYFRGCMSFYTARVIHVIPAIPACPVRPKSGHSVNARVYEYTTRSPGTKILACANMSVSTWSLSFRISARFVTVAIDPTCTAMPNRAPHTSIRGTKHYGRFAGIAGSIRFDARELHHFGRLFGFVGEELTEVGR